MKVVKIKNIPSLYNLFDISSIEVEDTIPFDIYIRRDKDYIIIIEAGTLISQKLYDKLKNKDSLYIAKKDEGKQVLNCATLKYYIRYNKDKAEKTIALLYDVNKQLFEDFMDNEDNHIDINCVQSIVKSIIFLIKYDEKIIRKVMPYLQNGYKIPDHSLHVTFYTVKLASLLNFSSEKLLQIGTAALMHDVGYKKIDNSILNKETPLSEEETRLINQHSRYSVDIIKQNHILDPYIINAVMQHHERYDGHGYPDQLMEKDISDFASILGICDVFDALTNNRPHRHEYSSFDALKMMMKDTSMINKFNQEYLALGLRSL